MTAWSPMATRSISANGGVLQTTVRPEREGASRSRRESSARARAAAPRQRGGDVPRDAGHRSRRGQATRGGREREHAEEDRRRVELGTRAIGDRVDGEAAL